MVSLVMSKARRQVQENLKFVDFVTILVDAAYLYLVKILCWPRLLVINQNSWF